jgi:hypothetical protein
MLAITSGKIYDPNSNVDSSKPLYEQELPPRTGFDASVYAEGAYMIMSSGGARNIHSVYHLTDGGRTMTFMAEYHSFADALTTIDRLNGWVSVKS